MRALTQKQFLGLNAGFVVCHKESPDEAHLSALGYSQKAYPWLSCQNAYPRRSRGHTRSPGSRPFPAFGLRPSGSFGFSKEQRLRRRAQISTVLGRGRSTSSGGMQLHSMPSDCGPRLGVIAGRRAWPLAVDRNRFRRLVRETFRLSQHRLQARDYIVRVRTPQANQPSGAEIRELFAPWYASEAVGKP